MEKETLKSIGISIFEAKTIFTLWKGVAYSRSDGVLPKELAVKYTETQNTAPSFFITAERSALISFVILLLHPIDKDTRAYSFFKVDKNKTDKFIEENKDIISEITLVRNKVFAHKDIEVNERTLDSFKIPSLERLELFFDKLIQFHNDLTKEYDNSSTDFDHACDNLLHEMDYMLMNISRGEAVRLKEIDLRWMWEEDPNRISKILSKRNK